MPRSSKKAAPKKITRYEHSDAHDPRTPETGHTDLLVDEQVVEVPMDNGWTDSLQLGRVDGDRTVVIDMDPAVDPVLLWSGKRNRRDVPVLPLQRNEIVTESRIGQIIERAKRGIEGSGDHQGSLFAELERELRHVDKEKRVEFYTHDEQWRNKLICGDSLQVMESLIKYEGMAGGVQMIYIDPPYGVKYNSNFQQRIDTTTIDGKDHADDVVAVKAFRDTWTLGIHSYLSYLRDRLYLSRELLATSGSVFVQISDDHVHEVRSVMDEVFGSSNFCSLIAFTKTTGQSSSLLPAIADYLLWYSRDREQVKFRQLLQAKSFGGVGSREYTNVELADGSIRKIVAEELLDPSLLPEGARVFATGDITAEGGSELGSAPIELPNGIVLECGPNLHWKVKPEGILRLFELGRLMPRKGKRIYKRFYDDFPYLPLNHLWTDVRGEPNKDYVVQTSATVVLRCIAMTTDPGDLVFDPTCGAGTSAICAERLGRRWVTCDTSRVSVNVARRRLLSSTFEHFVLSGHSPSQGFELESVPRITMSSLAYDREAEHVSLVDQPISDKDAIRVCGPFEVMSLGRYSLDDWKGYLVTGEAGEPAKLENYVAVMCRLYRPHAEIGGGTGFLHAIADSGNEQIGISIGPLTGRVTPKQIQEAAAEARQHGLPEVHVLGWAFEANVGEQIDELRRLGKVGIHLAMIRPDALAEGLKVTKPDQLFSPLALPEITIDRPDDEITVTLDGVGVFDRKTRVTDWHVAGDGYVAAWYLDEDYDGDCFVDCQMFFDFKKAPNLRPAAGGEVDADEFEMRFTSEPFSVGEYKRVAVKVVDVYGNESTVVRSLLQ